jgi:hypothetical protein
VVIPRSQKQKREAQKATGQNRKDQKEFIAHVQKQGLDRATFRGGKVAIERKLPQGSKVVSQTFLWRDYTRDIPYTFREMKEVTELMLDDMPAKVYGRDAFYTLLSQQYGPIGQQATKGKVLQLLSEYHGRYDPGSAGHRGHEKFAEQLIGFQMMGTFAQVSQYEIEQRKRREAAKQRSKLRFSKTPRCPARNTKGQQCTRVIRHKGVHHFR